MNPYVKSQILNMVTFAKTFERSCDLATKMDDGITSKAEMKTIQKISATTNAYIKELEKISRNG